MDEYDNRYLSARQIATHEIGHVILALYHRVAFKDVNIIAENNPDAKDGELWGWEGRMSFEGLGGIGGHRAERRVTGTKTVHGEVHEVTKPIPLSDKQKAENIIDCKILLGGPLAEEVVLGEDDSWQTLWRKYKYTDISMIEVNLLNNLITDKGLPTKDEIAETLKELQAETLLLFVDGQERTPLWGKCCRIADALYSRRSLTFAECWALYDGEELPPRHVGFGVYLK